ncbi:MAG: PDZ domain-containing protein [Bacteroidetes bacterium]|nr:PDZ domain-containing protein [Bacteroidota bacterium]
MKYYFSLLATWMFMLIGTTNVHAQASVYSGFFEGKAFLGVHSNSISKVKAQKLGFENPYGSYISGIVQNSAAEEAGLLAFDYIVAIDDNYLDRNYSLTDILGKYHSGDDVVIHFIRNGEKKSVDVVLGEKSLDIMVPSISSEKAFLGVTLHPDSKYEKSGVKVKVLKETTAEEIGLKSGDVITRINGNRIVDWADIETAVSKLEGSENVNVEYMRDDQINTAEGNIKSKSIFGFASPLPKMKEFFIGDPPFLGIYTEKMPKYKADKLGIDNYYGCYVSGVIPNTGAEEAGIKPFDLIFGIDEYRTGEEQYLGHILKKFVPGDEVTVHLYRAGKKMSLPLTLGRKMDVKEMKLNKCDQPFFGIRHDSEKSKKVGAIAINTVDNSTAEGIGLKNGDVILTINDYKMIDWTDIGIAIDNMKPGSMIEVVYLRDGKEMNANGPIKSYRETRDCEEGNSLLNLGFLKDLDIDFDFDFDHLFEKGDKKHEWVERAEYSSVSIKVDELSSNEARDMNDDFDINLPISNTLDVEDMKIAADTENNELYVTFNLGTKGETGVYAYNANGREVYEYELGNFSGVFSDDLDLLANGTGKYYLLIKQGEKMFAKKILIKGN